MIFFNKRFMILLVSLFFCVSAYAAITWTENVATTMSSTTIGAASDSSVVISLTDISFTGDNTADSAIITDIASTAGMYVGMAVTFDGESSTIASINSSTQITLADNITDANTGAAGTAANSYDQMLVQVVVTLEASTDGVDINLYSSSDKTTWDTTPFRTFSISAADAGSAYNVSFQLYQYMYPRVKIVISNPATESGTDDDIAATVKFAGRTQ